MTVKPRTTAELDKAYVELVEVVETKFLKRTALREMMTPADKVVFDELIMEYIEAMEG